MANTEEFYLDYQSIEAKNGKRTKISETYSINNEDVSEPKDEELVPKFVEKDDTVIRFEDTNVKPGDITKAYVYTSTIDCIPHVVWESDDESLAIINDEGYINVLGYSENGVNITATLFAIPNDTVIDTISTTLYIKDINTTPNEAPEIIASETPNTYTITADDDVDIYYTIDGTTPNRYSEVYSEDIVAIVINKDTVIKAVVITDDKTPDSTITTLNATYIPENTEDEL